MLKYILNMHTVHSINCIAHARMKKLCPIEISSLIHVHATYFFSSKAEHNKKMIEDEVCGDKENSYYRE